MSHNRVQRLNTNPAETSVSPRVLPEAIESADKFRRALRASSRRLADSRTIGSPPETPSQTQHTGLEKRQNELSRHIGYQFLNDENWLPEPDINREHGDLTRYAPRLQSNQCAMRASSISSNTSHRDNTALDLCKVVTDHCIRQDVLSASMVIQLPSHVFGGMTLQLTRGHNQWHLSAKSMCKKSSKALVSALPELRNRFKECGLGQLTW